MPISAGLRFALVVAGTFLAGQLIGWTLPFLSSVFAGMFVLGPRPMPATAALRLLLTLTAIVAVGLVASVLLAPYPLVLLAVLALVLLLVFHHAASGGNMLQVVFLLIAALLLPILALQSSALAVTVAAGLMINMAVALFAAGLGYVLVPPADAPPQAHAKPAAPTDPRATALRTLLVVYPLVVAFLAFGWTSVLTLIIVAILAQQQSSAAGFKAGSGMLLANLAGGLVAIAAYELLVAAPSLTLMAVLVALVLTGMARVMTAGGTLAALAPSAANAFVILLGGALAPFGDEVDAKLDARLAQLALAVAYIAVAFWLLETWRRPAGQAMPAPQRRRPA